MKKDFTLKYGKGTIEFSLDRELVLDEIRMKAFDGLKYPKKEILEAINNPIGCKPFKENFTPGDKVAFIVNDSTRIANSYQFLPVMMDELNSMGIPDEDMFIIFALGAHRAMRQEEMVTEVGEAVAGRVKMHNGDCHDKDQFKYFGTTSFGTPVAFHKLVAEADRIICTGSVLPHYLAGYGGGRKAMLPGVAWYETIRNNHSMIFDPNSKVSKLHGNPVYDDQIEAVEMCRPTFLINVVLNEKKETVRVFAGDYINAHIEACKFVDEIYVTDIKEEADLVIISSGGYPKDIDIYQLHKTMINGWCAVRQGGIVIVVGECRDGSGSDTYEQIMQEHKTPERVEKATRANFQVGAHKAYGVTSLMYKAQFILVSEVDEALAKMLQFTPAKDMDAALTIAFEKLGKKPKIIVMPQGSFTLPRVKKTNS